MTAIGNEHWCPVSRVTLPPHPYLSTPQLPALALNLGVRWQIIQNERKACCMIVKNMLGTRMHNKGVALEITVNISILLVEVNINLI